MIRRRSNPRYNKSNKINEYPSLIKLINRENIKNIESYDDLKLTFELYKKENYKPWADDHEISIGLKGRPAYCIYFIINPFTKFTKIGLTKNIQNRIADIDNASGQRNVVFLAIYPSQNELSSIELEKFFHKYFNSRRVIGEWFDLYLEDLKNIKRLVNFMIDDFLTESDFNLTLI